MSDAERRQAVFALIGRLHKEGHITREEWTMLMEAVSTQNQTGEN